MERNKAGKVPTLVCHVQSYFEHDRHSINISIRWIEKVIPAIPCQATGQPFIIIINNNKLNGNIIPFNPNSFYDPGITHSHFKDEETEIPMR